MKLTHASLFSGVGGIDLAAEAAGFRTCAQVEISPFAEASSHPDSRTPDYSQISAQSGGGDIRDACGGAPTVLSGGFPCQPVSLAGRRKGSDDSRWLWPEYLRLIHETRPAWIVAENVAALLNIPEFKGIYSDLQGEGYEIGIFLLSASGVGAPHQRRRCFIVANSVNERLQEVQNNSRGLPLEVSVPAGLCGPDSGRTCETVNPDSFAGLQTNQSADSVRESRKARHCASRLSWSGLSLPDWSGHPSAICRVDDGISHKLDKSRLQALGNAVVPRVAYPIFESIARIERGEV